MDTHKFHSKKLETMCVCVCVRACVRACVRVCVNDNTHIGQC